MTWKIIGIVGSYRRDRTIDRAVSAVLEAAAASGAETEKVSLLDLHVEFCTNCRRCTQEPGPERGRCIHDDDLDALLDRIEAADALVLGTPVNCYNTTALFRRFQERLVACYFWPWGAPAPRLRRKEKPRKAVLVTSSAAPDFYSRLFTGALRALRLTADALGAKPAGSLYLGKAALHENQALPPAARRKAQRLGERLARP